MYIYIKIRDNYANNFKLTVSRTYPSLFCCPHVRHSRASNLLASAHVPQTQSLSRACNRQYIKLITDNKSLNHTWGILINNPDL